MKKINAIISSFAFLLLAVLMSACNKDGIETIVIEDGQPSVAQMLIGRWNPTGGEMANPNTGEVTEDINISDIPWLDFGENGIGSWGNGGSGTGGSAGESFDVFLNVGQIAAAVQFQLVVGPCPFDQDLFHFDLVRKK